ncbi:hypothetical protein GCM10011344_27310 [Dokdonia pacifica]|uniref:Uncharacterized protein n=1 Tax=Dokdonia pacifica TaxID=1627892 RepID=A0A239E555_9FLAO|nr:hypothetical protein [Dokdonia pacifica]GGG25174.1 hypothetical protein GCM10011344_27310 [Dokdonia pacifica]SNS39870.1 hypothetical protein SAMN06265376_11413 [Dokdonia pacifica]
MNKKKRTRYLLIAVILIYGAVIARFFMLSNDGDYSLPTNELVASFKPTSYDVKENFTINNDYRDPFLGTLIRDNKNTSSDSRKEITNKKEAYFPAITYLGIISDAGSSKKVLSLRINAKEYVIKEGNTVDSIQVISGNRQSLLVSYKGKRKRITISD